MGKSEADAGALLLLRRALSGSRAVDRLLRRVREHVMPEAGMTNESVEELCEQICSPRFRGLYPADKIPAEELSRLREFVIIVNTATSEQLNGHFVTLSREAGADHVEYMDSLAQPCTQPDVRSFVSALGGEGEARCTVRRRVQASWSVHCGLYAILFAAYKDRKPGFQLLFSPTDLAGNDERCVRYLRRIVKEEL